MIKVKKVKTEAGFVVYRATATKAGISVTHRSRRKALKKLDRKLGKNKIAKIVKKFLHIK